MPFLEFLYALALSTQKQLASPEPRYIPFLALTMYMIGTAYAAIRLIAGLVGPELQTLLSQRDAWREMDWAYVLALAVASAITWIGFDRRRDQIEAKFSWIPACSSNANRLLIGAMLLGSGMGFLMLDDEEPLLTIGLFVAIAALGSVIVKLKFRSEN